VFLLAGIALAIFVVPDAWRLPVVLGFAVLEVIETTVTWRFSRRGKTKVGPETLIGAIGVAITDCRPSGMVRVRGEVVGRDGLMLHVEPADSLTD
jgi:membrane protein implicated in regulation of membrane protease activity